MFENLVFITFFFFNDTATTEIYTLSLHDALPISQTWTAERAASPAITRDPSGEKATPTMPLFVSCAESDHRSEEHTSELHSRQYLVCRLLLEKKKNMNIQYKQYLVQLYSRSV